VVVVGRTVVVVVGRTVVVVVGRTVVVVVGRVVVVGLTVVGVAAGSPDASALETIGIVRRLSDTSTRD